MSLPFPPDAPLTIDPALFSDAAVAPDVRAMNERIEAALATLPTVTELGAQKVRQRRAEGGGVLADEPPHPGAIWAEGDGVPLRLFGSGTPGLKGVYLHIHGGGHTLGSAGAQDQTLMAMAERLGIGVASIDYRLAPEHPWPAAPDDCEKAALWLAREAQAVFGTSRIVIGGDSAGAHLAAVTMLRLRDRHGIVPFCAANLIYGVFDLAGTPSMLGWGERNLVLSTPIVEWFCDNLLPSADYPPGRRRQGDISPLYAPLCGLCPALFTCGTLDPLIDDSVLMAMRWVAAGNPARLDLYPGGIHAFAQIKGLSIAEGYRARSDAFIRAALEA